mgnify:FL=1
MGSPPFREGGAPPPASQLPSLPSARSRGGQGSAPVSRPAILRPGFKPAGFPIDSLYERNPLLACPLLFAWAFSPAFS